jgi:LmbE family N-acetylglucosaminyl deacetylase
VRDSILWSCRDDKGLMRKNSFLFLIWAVLAALLVRDPGAGLHAQEDPWAGGSVGAGLLLRQLDGVKRVLMIGAHPDDEDTALLTALARGMGVEAAYLSLSRGEGGQNLLGPELDEGLGLVRTGELLAARALDGGTQYFSRAFDFGYSKSAEETFRFWPREELLRDVTWVVRSFRPHILVSVFSGTDRDGHGHHQVVGIMARDAFHAAGDPTRFPEQLAAGTAPWAPLKLYLLTRRNPREGTTVVETGTFDPLLGRSHFQVAMESRSQHRSQDMGAAQPLGPRRSTLALVESRVEQTGPDELFAGVDTTLLGLARDLPEPVGGEVRGALEAYRGALDLAHGEMTLLDPWAAAPHLGRAVEALGLVRKRLGGPGGPRAPGVSGGEGGPEGPRAGSPVSEELRRVVEARLPVLQEALLRSAGVVTDVRVGTDLLVPGETVEVTVEVWNGGPLPLAGLRAELEVPEGWPVEEGEGGDAFGPRDLAPGRLASWVMRVRVPAGEEPFRPYYLKEPREGEMYRWPEGARGGVPGSPGDMDLLRGRLTMNVEGAGPVSVVRTGRYRGVDKAAGEYSAPVLVVPALSVHLEPSSMAWPVGRSEPREVGVRVRNQAGQGRRGTIGLEGPPGWNVSPREHALDLAEAGAEASFSFRVTPPPDLEEGIHTLRARARTEDGTEYGEGVVLVDYPHISRTVLYAPAEAAVSVFPVELDAGFRVGYVMGSGDTGAEVLRQLGASVELLGPEAVRAGAYQGFHAVVLGIRAYETRADLAAANDRLLEYARSGGTVVVQYNKYEYPDGGFAPFPVTMARPHDRVTDKTAPVRILHPEHPVFRHPNPISIADFDGWVQERGLYFLRAWDDRFTPLLEMADPGEDPLRGGLVVARVGEGAYVYTGLAFFRQFPRGVPGAHRLFANLISLRGSQLHAP